MKRLPGSIAVASLGTIAFIAVFAAVPEHRGLAAHAYVLFVAALAVRALALEIVSMLPAPRRRRGLRRRASAPDLPSELSRLATSLAMSTTWATELYYRVRPALREIAADRLDARRGTSLDGDPEAARSALGEQAWALLRPDLSVPEDRFGPGLSLAELEQIVTSLEAV